jgi:hypothetical protein
MALIISTIMWAHVMYTFGTSHLAAMKELLLVLQSSDGRKGEEPNRAPHVPMEWMDEILSMLWDPPCHAINVSAPSLGLLLCDQAPKPWAQFQRYLRHFVFRQFQLEWMGDPLFLKMSIGCHLPQLDQTAQIFLEIWVLSLMINLRKLGSPENLMTIDLLYRWIFLIEIRLLTRLLAFST